MADGEAISSPVLTTKETTRATATDSRNPYNQMAHFEKGSC
jgi:hypothetical protein